MKVTLAKPHPTDYEALDPSTGELSSRPLSSFQPVRSSAKDPEANALDSRNEVPPIPEPDYSSDEEEKAVKNESKAPVMKQLVENGERQSSEGKESDGPMSGQSSVKLTTTATLVLKCSSPCPPADLSTNASNEPAKIQTFSSKNMFEELREQSAKITSSARLKFASNRQNSQEGDNLVIKKLSSQEASQPVNNVMKNVAEFEKRLTKDQIANRIPANGVIDPTIQMRMSKSCMEEFVPNNGTLRKGGIS